MSFSAKAKWIAKAQLNILEKWAKVGLLYVNPSIVQEGFQMKNDYEAKEHICCAF